MLILTDGFSIPDVPANVQSLFALVLNPMRGRMEEQRILAVSDSRDELKRFWDGELAPEPYRDERWQRTYKDGPLLWFNPPFGNGDVDDYGNGIIELRRDAAWRRVA